MHKMTCIANRLGTFLHCSRMSERENGRSVNILAVNLHILEIL